MAKASFVVAALVALGVIVEDNGGVMGMPQNLRAKVAAKPETATTYLISQSYGGTDCTSALESYYSWAINVCIQLTGSPYSFRSMQYYYYNPTNKYSAEQLTAQISMILLAARMPVARLLAHSILACAM